MGAGMVSNGACASLLQCVSGHLLAALATCQELPDSCTQSRQLCTIVEQAITVLHNIPATTLAAISIAADSKHIGSNSRPSYEDVLVAASDQSAKEPHSPVEDLPELKILQQSQQQQQQLLVLQQPNFCHHDQKHKHEDSKNQATGFPVHMAAAEISNHDSISKQVELLSSSDLASQLTVLSTLQQQVSHERDTGAGAAAPTTSDANTPVRSAICQAGGIDRLLHLIICPNSTTTTSTTGSSSSNTCSSTDLHTGSNSSMGCIASSNSLCHVAVAIAAGNLLLSVTDSGTCSRRSCNSWSHCYISTESVPALVQLLLHSDPIAQRAAELLTKLAKDSARHDEIAAAGGIAALLHILSTCSVSSVINSAPSGGNMSVPVHTPPSVWRRSYAMLAAAAAALEALIDGPEDVQVAIAQAGGVEVLENVCEYMALWGQPMLIHCGGTGKQQQQKLVEEAASHQALQRKGVIVRHTSASSMPWA